MTFFKLNCYTTESGNTIHADRSYCLGDYAFVVFTDRKHAESVMSDLQDDVGDVVEDSIEYEISEEDACPDGWEIK